MVTIAKPKPNNSNSSQQKTTSTTTTMLFKVSVKSLTLLAVVGVASVTGANLRHRRTTLFGSHGGNNGHDAPAVAPAASSTVQKQQPQQQQLRSGPSSVSSVASSSASGDNAIAVKAQFAAVAAAEPSLTMDRGIYLEDEPIIVTFAVGSPSHPYYSSSDAPSLIGSLDLDYAKYSIGLFMRDADPQGGTLAPIVSINACAAFGEDCDVDDNSYVSYGNVDVTFGSDYLDTMSGQWPLEVSSYGTGFDAYVLDGKGAAAIGPLEFYVRNEHDEDVDTTHSYNSSGPAKYHATGAGASSVENEEDEMPSSSISSRVANSPLMKYQKGTKKATERTHASVAKGVATSKANTKIMSGNNNVEMMMPVVAAGMAISEMGEGGEEEATTPLGTIASDKGEYEYDDSVTIDFSLIASQEEEEEEDNMMSKYRIGIFMRMAHPQGGELEPVVSLPLCPEGGGGCTVDDADRLTTMGSVTFSSETMDMMWPIDLYQWGTGFDAYILDETGDDVVGPVKFNIMMNDTY